jgi:DNA-directed RNA polymerase subunit RPC12/RpoP
MTRPTIVCPRCGSSRVFVQAVTQTKNRGCFGWAMWILLAILTIGLIIIIPLVTNSKSKTHTEAICQNCGHRWRV